MTAIGCKNAKRSMRAMSAGEKVRKKEEDQEGNVELAAVQVAVGVVSCVGAAIACVGGKVSVETCVGCQCHEFDTEFDCPTA
eukprot:6289755-Lingulodinium_polyedra.AAC.1